MKKISFFFALVFCMSLFQSCVKEPLDTPTEEVAPELPPEQAFVMPFDGFESADTSEAVRNVGDSRTLTSFRNWFYAATNVVAWNTAVTLTFAVPVASFKESFNQSPVPQGNGTWLWSYTHNVDGKNYQTKLYGTILSIDEIKWEMYITQAGAFSDFLWYEGSTYNDNAEASWTLYHRPYNPEPFIDVAYTRDTGNGVAQIRYTDVSSNQNKNGSYIEFRKGAAMDYNRNYDVYEKDIDNLMEIQWNEGSKDGRVKDLKTFNDEEWHCWDENLMDVDC